MRYTEYVGDYSLEIEGEAKEVIEVLNYLDKQGVSGQYDKELERVAKLAEDTRHIVKQIEKENTLQRVAKGL